MVQMGCLTDLEIGQALLVRFLRSFEHAYVEAFGIVDMLMLHIFASCQGQNVFATLEGEVQGPCLEEATPFSCTWFIGV